MIHTFVVAIFHTGANMSDWATIKANTQAVALLTCELQDIAGHLNPDRKGPWLSCDELQQLGGDPFLGFHDLDSFSNVVQVNVPVRSWNQMRYWCDMFLARAKHVCAEGNLKPIGRKAMCIVAAMRRSCQEVLG
jgi:hypothetical protein